LALGDLGATGRLFKSVNDFAQTIYPGSTSTVIELLHSSFSCAARAAPGNEADPAVAHLRGSDETSDPGRGRRIAGARCFGSPAARSPGAPRRCRCRKLHLCCSGGMVVFVEDAAESILSSDGDVIQSV
jgi:hypothetical protein